jgi:hypothetical protein
MNTTTNDTFPLDCYQYEFNDLDLKFSHIFKNNKYISDRQTEVLQLLQDTKFKIAKLQNKIDNRNNIWHLNSKKLQLKEKLNEQTKLKSECESYNNSITYPGLFTDLPIDVLFFIFSKCSVKDVCRLGSVSKQLAELAKNEPTWDFFCKKSWP